MVHWAVLARWEHWGGLRGEGEVGPVTVILSGVGREELGELVEQIYGRDGVEFDLVEEISVDHNMYQQPEVNGQDYKLETESIGDNDL